MPTMREFFERADVKALQNIQRTHKWGSSAHRKAFNDMKALAVSLGIDADKYFGEYE